MIQCGNILVMEGHEMTKILIVEDEKPIANLIDWNLSACGYTCSRAYDGLAAADLIQEHTLIFLIFEKIV